MLILVVLKKRRSTTKMKLPKFMIEIHYACRPPWGYGIANRTPEKASNTYAIMPFNLIIFMAIQFYYWVGCHRGECYRYKFMAKLEEEKSQREYGKLPYGMTRILGSDVKE